MPGVRSLAHGFIHTLLMLDILIPVLGRPQRVQPLLENISEATEVPHRVLFLASTGDTAEIAELEKAKAEFLLLEAPPAQGQYAKKINQGYEHSDAEFLFLGADDLLFRPGWSSTALAYMQKASVVGINDKGNAFVRQGLLAPHPIVRREYIETQGGSLDGPGLVYHEGYSHNFVDCEFSVLARSRGVFRYARNAIVEHLHPVFSRGEMDETYAVGLRDFDHDRSLFVRRMADFPRDHLVRRFSQADKVVRQRHLRQNRRR